mgnify:CR=1 FL=1
MGARAGPAARACPACVPRQQRAHRGVRCAKLRLPHFASGHACRLYRFFGGGEALQATAMLGRAGAVCVHQRPTAVAGARHEQTSRRRAAHAPVDADRVRRRCLRGRHANALARRKEHGAGVRAAHGAAMVAPEPVQRTRHMKLMPTGQSAVRCKK